MRRATKAEYSKLEEPDRSALLPVERKTAALRDIVAETEECRPPMEQWNRTETALPRGCMHELFAEQAERKRDAVAVEFSGEQLTYGGLNRGAINWRVTCKPRASGRRCAWACAWSDPLRWSWRY
jgi:hypothetical protein